MRLFSTMATRDHESGRNMAFCHYTEVQLRVFEPDSDTEKDGTPELGSKDATGQACNVSLFTVQFSGSGACTIICQHLISPFQENVVRCSKAREEGPH